MDFVSSYLKLHFIRCISCVGVCSGSASMRFAHLVMFCIQYVSSLWLMAVSLRRLAIGSSNDLSL